MKGNLIRKQVMTFKWLDEKVQEFADKNDMSYSEALRIFSIEGLKSRPNKAEKIKNIDDYYFMARKELDK